MRGPPVAVVAAAVLMIPAAVRAGVVDTPLPTFADGQPAQVVTILPQASKGDGIETEVICTNLAVTEVDVGLEVFDQAGVRGNTIGAGNGALLAVAPGRTVTLATGGTAVFHEDAIITLEPPVTALRQGSARIVATSAQIGCVAFAVDRHHLVETALTCPDCRPPTLTSLTVLDAPADVPAGSTSTTAQTNTSTTITSTTTTATPASTTSSSTTTTPTGSVTTTVPVTSTTTAAGVSTTTAAPSTTTVPPPTCAVTPDIDRLRCLCRLGEHGVCRDETLPRRVARRFSQACTLADRAAADRDPRRSGKVASKATKALRQTARLGAQAAKHGGLSRDCARALGR